MGLFSRKERKPRVIDLRDRLAVQEFGRPTPCPACGGRGYLDGIDVKGGIMFQHCTDCAAKWETSEAELALQSPAPPDGERRPVP